MTTLEAPIAASEQSHHLECMEIWGGNTSRADAIAVPGIDAWVYSTPYRGHTGGGDVHYVSSCGAGNISRFAVADVSGHGIEMDELAGTLRRLVRKHINTPNQARFARALNQEFSNLEKQGKFATAILATYFAPNDHLIIVNAGHPRPLWYHAATGRWERLDSDSPETVDDMRNLPLGVIEPTEFRQFAVQLEKGDVILIFTDALIEATNEAGMQLGEAGLLERVRQLDATDPQTLGPALLAAVRAHRGGEAPDDDETLIVLHHNAADPPRQSITETLTVLAKMMGLKKV